MSMRFSSLALALSIVHLAARLAEQEGSILPPAPTPTDVKPGSITCDECPYPHPSKYLDIRVYTQDVRIAYMDVAAQGAANGHTVLLLHGNKFLILQKEKIEKAMVIGHSMGGMLAARFATQYPKAVERLVIYNPIGLTDGRFDRPMPSIDDSYQQTLKSDYQSTRASLSRYVAHNPKAWNAEFETYTRIRYSWTLSADWP